jgi:glycosyltransferase involved in cell wall biosynthesis
VEDGVTGFIVDDEEEAVRAVRRVGELDRRRVREGFERRFTAKRMAEEYVRYYEMLADAKQQPTASLVPTDAEAQ